MKPSAQDQYLAWFTTSLAALLTITSRHSEAFVWTRATWWAGFLLLVGLAMRYSWAAIRAWASSMAKPEPPALDVAAEIVRPIEACPKHFHDTAWNYGRSFLALKVSNCSESNIANLAARVFVVNSGRDKTPSYWSAKLGDEFTEPEAKSAADESVPTGKDRVLLIAQVFQQVPTWARLPSKRAELFVVPGVTTRMEGRETHVFYSRDGERLSLGSKSTFRVEFWAEGVRLDFDVTCALSANGKPLVTVSPALRDQAA